MERDQKPVRFEMESNEQREASENLIKGDDEYRHIKQMLLISR